MEELVRELFIGLGGTGGKTLAPLYEQMTEEQRRFAKYVFIDTDKKDIDKMRISGIESIHISNADTVRQIAESLGSGDGVTEWLPNGSSEGKFLESRCDDGASQCRFKSRLCLARFFNEGAPGLRELLEEMTRPGAITENNRLRVVIVASIAGGTGAGTFIQMALYIRKFFRKLNQKAEIIGILSLPDLYIGKAKNDTEKDSMFANAYASIRELNAMNLATNPPEDPRGPGAGDGKPRKSASNHLQGYGMRVNIKLRTNSEGVLFDSKDLSFQMDVSAKPYDLIYFVDKASEKGGILKDLREYYRIMADIAYTRLYSPMNAAIASGESNELRNHTQVPTAIYGSAGYARVLYPYQDILRYLSEKKLYDDLDAHWLYLDSLWDSDCLVEQDAARAFGGHWTPKPGQRGRKYRDDLIAELHGEKSKFAFLKSMINGKTGVSRALLFKDAVTKAAKSLTLSKDENGVTQLPDDAAALRASGGKYSVLRDSEVVRVVAELADLAKPVYEEDADSESLLSTLLGRSAQVENAWVELVAALESAVKTQSQKLYSAVLPLTDVAVRTQDRTSPISLHYGLLSVNGKDVHPLAARYLLYSLQEICMNQSGADKDLFRKELDKCLRKIRLALDDDKSDDDDITIDEAVDETKNRRMRRKNKDALAAEMLNDFNNELKANLVQALMEADRAVVNRTFAELSEPVDELVSLYEGFFRTIQPYRDELNQKVYADLNRHDKGGNQTIYVGASSDVKRAYSVDASVVGALTSDPEATYSAAGAGVYENLFNRLRKRMAEIAQARSLGEKSGEIERVDNMDSIFDNIIAKYMELLDQNETTLKTNAVGALINEICADLDIGKGDIDRDAATRQKFDTKFRETINDLRAKARPMIRYNETNSQNYYLEETKNALLNVSKTYCNFGFSPACAEVLEGLYPDAEVADLANFRSRMNIGTDNELFCFSAVHCLQPTQIYHFLETQDEDGYYPYYRARISSDLDSDNPHLDKRWGRHGAMPFISADLELKWRRIVMKALIYEALHGKINFTVDRYNAKVFVREEDNSTKFLFWPKGDQILVRNISRLVEYLAEDEDRVEAEAEALDKRVNMYCRSLYNYAETPRKYKEGMTKNEMLTLLRKDMIAFLETDKNVKSSKILVDEEADGYAVDIEQTLGGVLHVAYLMHRSEERLGEDKDYGEALLSAAADIVDRFASGMNGFAPVDRGSELYKEYVEIYNWTVDKFLEDWLKRAVLEAGIKAEPEPEQTEARPRPARTGRLQDIEEPVMSTKTARIDVPAEIQRSNEYIWINNNWKFKSFQDA